MPVTPGRRGPWESQCRGQLRPLGGPGNCAAAGSLGLEVPYKRQVLPEDSGRIALDPGSSLRSYELPAPCNLQKPEDRA